MTVRIIQGDVRKKLAELPGDHFDCIVTSPPYHGLRDYGTATWEGGNARCDHKMPSGQRQDVGRACVDGFNGPVSAELGDRNYKNICAKCGARRIDAQIGLEPTLDAYLETMVAVCRELRRVLKPSGVFFLVIGDSYAANGCSWLGATISTTIGQGPSNRAHSSIKKQVPYGLKPKDLCLVPERLGILLQNDGWWVRSHIIWAKKNCMPESVTDRPTSSHETVWMLTKGERYFWDAEAVKDGSIDPESHRPWKTRNRMAMNDADPYHSQTRGFHNIPNGKIYRTRNLRNVWHLASHPFPGAHFATFPPELVERCIKAGSSERGCCAGCGMPWVRVIEIERVPHRHPPGRGGGGRQFSTGHLGPTSMFNSGLVPRTATLCWRPSCQCGADAISARILDPFAGAGTTGLVADRLGRDCTLIDLNTKYAEMAFNRIKNDAPLFAEVAAE